MFDPDISSSNQAGWGRRATARVFEAVLIRCPHVVMCPVLGSRCCKLTSSLQVVLQHLHLVCRGHQGLTESVLKGARGFGELLQQPCLG